MGLKIQGTPLRALGQSARLGVRRAGRVRRFIRATRFGGKSEVLAWAKRNAPPLRTAGLQQYSYLLKPPNAHERLAEEP